LEWQETMNKGRAIFRAVAMAEAGIERHGCDPGAGIIHSASKAV
jgi:anthranilate synthase component 1